MRFTRFVILMAMGSAGMLAVEGDGDRWAALVRAANVAREQARFQEAADRVSEAVELAGRPDQPGTRLAETLLLLGAANADMGRLRDAERAFLRSLAIWERSAPDNPSRTAPMMGLATVYTALQEYSKAERFAAAAIRIREQASGHPNPDLGGALQNMAAVYHSERRFAEAAALYRQALEHLVPNGRLDDVATVHSNLGLALAEMGRAGEAAAETGQAIALWETAGPREQPRLAVGLTNLAVQFGRLGRWPEAERSIRRAREIAAGILGPDDPSLVPVLNVYADVLRHTGRKPEARRMEREAETLRLAAAAENLTGYTLDVKSYRP